MAEVQGAPAQEGGESGGAEEAVAAVGSGLQALAEAEPAFKAVLEAFAQTVDQLKSGGAPSRAPNETTTPEQGGNPNAVPMSHGRPA